MLPIGLFLILGYTKWEPFLFGLIPWIFNSSFFDVFFPFFFCVHMGSCTQKAHSLFCSIKHLYKPFLIPTPMRHYYNRNIHRTLFMAIKYLFIGIGLPRFPIKLLFPCAFCFFSLHSLHAYLYWTHTTHKLNLHTVNIFCKHLVQRQYVKRV